MIQQNKHHSPQALEFLTRKCFPSLQWSTVDTVSWIWPKLLSHTGGSDFLIIRVVVWVKSQIAKILSILLRQQRPLSHCCVVNVFWVVSQRQSTSWLQIHYCSSPWSDSSVPFKRRRTMKYVVCCKCPVVFSDQVSEKMMMWKILKQNPSLSENFLLPFTELICEWNVLCVQFTVQDQIVQKKILFACGKCTKIFSMAYLLKTAMFSECTAARKQEISSGVSNLSEL